MRDTLLLAAGELRREFLSMIFEMDHLDKPIDGSFYFSFCLSPKPKAVADVFFDGHFRKQCVGLKNNAGAAHACRLFGDIFSVQNDAAGVRRFRVRQ